MKKLIPIFILSVALAGCGATNEGSREEIKQQETAPAKTTPKATQPTAASKLPAFTSGVIKIDGRTRGSLTTLNNSRYATTGGSQIQLANSGEARGYAAFCRGQIDMVDAARPISQSEYAVCKRNGLQVVQFQVASDAIVAATKAETDIGLDCIDVSQLRDMYRAGSPISNWSQVGGDSLGLTVTGPNDENNAFSFFGRYVLGSAEPSLQDLRSDYRAQETDKSTREYVVGRTADIDRAKRNQSSQASYTKAKEEVERQKDFLVEANRFVRSAEYQVKKGKADRRSAAQQSKDLRNLNKQKANQRKVSRSLALAYKRLGPAKARAELDAKSTKNINALKGRVGYFRFSYYELYEDQLRPLEIDLGNGKRNCIFPSQRTVTNAVYPLSRQLLITTSTRSLARQEVKEYLNTYLDNAQELAEDQRLVPLPDANITTEKAWVNGTRKPTLVTYGQVQNDTPKATTPQAPQAPQ